MTMSSVFGSSMFDSAGFADHLGLDAVVAFTDGEMGLVAFQRAAAHIARCPDCAREVEEQTLVRQQLRTAPCPPLPSSLADCLRSIPVALPLRDPGTSAGS